MNMLDPKAIEFAGYLGKVGFTLKKDLFFLKKKSKEPHEK